MDEHRVERELEDLQARMRAVETVQAPIQARIVEEFRQLQADVKDIDLNGSHNVRLQIASLVRDIHRLEIRIKEGEDSLNNNIKDVVAEIEKWDDDQRAVRNTLRAGIILAAISFCSSVIVLVINVVIRSATGGGP